MKRSGAYFGPNLAVFVIFLDPKRGGGRIRHWNLTSKVGSHTERVKNDAQQTCNPQWICRLYKFNCFFMKQHNTTLSRPPGGRTIKQQWDYIMMFTIKCIMFSSPKCAT